MQHIQIGLDGVVNPNKINLGNKYENNDEQLAFELPSEYNDYKKYLVGVIKRQDEPNLSVVLPINGDTFNVSSGLTWHDGTWYLYVMCREHDLDLSQERVDLSAKNGEHVFISNGFIGIVNKSYIDQENVQNAPLDSNLQIVYDDLLLLKKQLEDMMQGGVGGDGLVVPWDKVSGKPKTFPPDVHTHTKTQISDMPTSLSDFSNDVGYLTDVPQDYVAETKAELDKKPNVSDFAEMSNNDILAIANKILFA